MIKIMDRKADRNNNGKRKLKESISLDSQSSVKPRITITITDTDDMELPENQLEAVFKQFENLRKAQTDFEQFLIMVRKDLKTKSESLKKLKTCETSNRSDKSYASVQLFMLSQYKHRMNKFENVSRKSIENISMKNHSDIKVDDLVSKHINILVKMKRRMKHMIDVSEKHAVVDMFDTVNSMKELCGEMDPFKHDKESRLCKSMLSLDTIQEDSSFSSGTGSGTDSKAMSKTLDKDCPTIRKPKMLKSLTDHIGVFTKTFTNRK